MQLNRLPHEVVHRRLPARSGAVCPLGELTFAHGLPLVAVPRLLVVGHILLVCLPFDGLLNGAFDGRGVGEMRGIAHGLCDFGMRSSHLGLAFLVFDVLRGAFIMVPFHACRAPHQQ